MATTTAFAFMSALKTDLEARTPALDGVTVATASLHTDTPREAIILHSVNANEDYMAMGKSKLESYTVEGAIWIRKAGKGQTVIEEAQTRAVALFGELETQLQSASAIGTELDAQITSFNITQGITEKGRWCQIDFSISVRARKA